MKGRKLLWSAMAAVLLSATTVDACGLSGSWRGSLDVGQAKLPLVFNFTESAEGVTLCTMDSPAQGARGIATEVVYCSADSVALTCRAIGASYAGRISAGSIEGHFRQGGFEFPLDLAPEEAPEVRRPQTPKPPFPYAVRDTGFTAADGAVMSATLTMPLGTDSRKMPAVVMVSGSGPQNRDEELMEHKPFAVLADYLARNGIASLRYDDRGTGRSTGDFRTATTYTFRDDAASGIALLRGVPAIGPVGVLGHSEGGTVAFMLGADGKTDFIVSLAGMAVSGKETLMRQNRHSLERAGLAESDKVNSLKMIALVLDSIEAQASRGVSTAIDFDAMMADNGLTVPQEVMRSLRMTQSARTPWFDAFVGLDPRHYLAEVKCPTLAINGTKDTQVLPDNLKVVKELVPHAETLEMPGLNHLMQHAVTGEVTEYGEIRETMSPEVLAAIVRFIVSSAR